MERINSIEINAKVDTNKTTHTQTFKKEENEGDEDFMDRVNEWLKEILDNIRGC